MASNQAMHCCLLNTAVQQAGCCVPASKAVMDKQQLAVAGAAATAGALVYNCAWYQDPPDRNGSTIETILWDPEQRSSHSSPNLLDSDQPSPIHKTMHATL